MGQFEHSSKRVRFAALARRNSAARLSLGAAPASPGAARASLKAMVETLEIRQMLSVVVASETTQGQDGLTGTAVRQQGTLSEAKLTRLEKSSAAVDRVWRGLTAVPTVKNDADQIFFATSVAPFRADLGGLRTRLRSAPLEDSVLAGRGKPIVMTLPNPDGQLERFSIWESPIMEPELAKKFKQIKTYAGRGLDDPSRTVRFDVTPAGLRAQVLGGDGAYYIDPLVKGSTASFGSYWRRDAVQAKSAEGWSCLTGSDVDTATTSALVSAQTLANHAAAVTLDGQGGQPPCGCSLCCLSRDAATASGDVVLSDQPTSGIRSSDQPTVDPVDPFGTGGGVSNITFGGTLRTFRLAVAATGEYTAAVGGGTVAGGQAAIVTAINRVTGVYETELSIRLVLVANNSSLVYTNSITDPYTNNDGPTLLGQNQTNITNVIGSANYDVGHVFSTGGGGVANLGVVGNNNFKARGVTGLPNPTGDAFYIDYVAHEMGHQFGGNHTFNTSANPQRNGSTAYETGSGSSIQAYAGIVGSGEDLQNNSDPFFHSVSIDEIRNYIGTIPSVGTSTSNGNFAPTVSAGSGFTIPASTPFTLTATGSDANGDTLTYDWQERALGPAVLLSAADNGTSPLTRVFRPTTNPSRTVPRLSNLLNNTLAVGEKLPTASRGTWTWRVIARDNRAGGGGVTTADVNLAVVNTGAAFAVTAPNTAVAWSAGSPQTVSWNVAGTTANGINTASVSISLSTDGGNTFPTTLIASTANDGTEQVTLPFATSTTQARIRVAAVGNIFFDVSNANFTVVSGVAAAPGTPTLSAASDTGQSSSDGITRLNNATPAQALIFSVPGVTSGNTVRLFAGGTQIGSAVATGSTVNITTDGLFSIPDGSVQITANQSTAIGSSSFSPSLALTIDTSAPTVGASLGISLLVRSSALSSTLSTFSESVFGVTAANYTLTQDGAPASLAAASVTGSGTSWTLGGLTSATAASSIYVLGFNGTGLTDAAGNVMVAGASQRFVVNVIELSPQATENVVRIVTSPSNGLAVSIFVNSPTATFNWTFSVGEVLRIDGSSGTDRVQYVGNAAVANNAVLRVNSGGGADVVEAQGGTLLVPTDYGPNVAFTAFSGARITFNANQNIDGLTLQAGATVVANGSLTTPSVSIANDGAPIPTRQYTAFLDLRANPLVVRNGDVTEVRDAVRAWSQNRLNPQGIGSTSAGTYTTVAAVSNLLQPGLGFRDSVGGVSLNPSDVVARLTYNGDLDRDGLVTATDLIKLIEGLSIGATGWENGDVNYDGVINAADLTLLTDALGQNLPQL